MAGLRSGHDARLPPTPSVPREAWITGSSHGCPVQTRFHLKEGAPLFRNNSQPSWPDLIRPSTRLPPTGSVPMKAWITGTSPVMTISGRDIQSPHNPICSAPSLQLPVTLSDHLGFAQLVEHRAVEAQNPGEHLVGVLARGRDRADPAGGLR